MSQEPDKTSPSEMPESEGIRVEPPPFEHGYQPESLPKISVPDLPADAQGLSAEALSQVPTLTELVHEPAEEVEVNTEASISDAEQAEVNPPKKVFKRSQFRPIHGQRSCRFVWAS
jgi:hypothetical protein